jgi:hypothetical protein
MLKCEGYKMFRGSALITPKNATMLPFRVEGDWLYKPDAKCWYCNGHSFPEGIVGDIQEAE